jgi:hypothetical protein
MVLYLYVVLFIVLSIVLLLKAVGAVAVSALASVWKETHVLYFLKQCGPKQRYLLSQWKEIDPRFYLMWCGW